MPVSRRTYESQDCPVARTLDVVGDRWTVLILRDVFHRKRKFKEMMESLQGISPNLLADRLKRLEERGFLERRFYSDHPPRAEYRLTEKGKAFGAVLQSLASFGEAWESQPSLSSN